MVPFASAYMASSPQTTSHSALSNSAQPDYASAAKWVDEALRVLNEESDAIRASAASLDPDAIAAAVKILWACAGTVVVTGMGKSGAVGRKFAGTLASTGTRAHFLHPAEALHGDLGVLAPDDAAVIFSYSGETDEVLHILPSLRQLGLPIIVLCGKPESSIGRAASVVVDVSVAKEACPLNLAPTTSTTVMMAYGDALAVATMVARDFSAEQYAVRHPSGSLGRRLLLRVADIMRTGDSVAIVDDTATLRDVLFAITQAHAGAAIVVNSKGTIAGMVTDGDARRFLVDDESSLTAPVAARMNRSPGIVPPHILAVDALSLLEKFYPVPGERVGEAPVVDAQGRPVGMLMLKDLVKAGIL